MSLSIITLSLSKKYVDDTVKGLGALKGSPCTIKNISSTESGSIITFEWTATNGTKQTSQLNIINGVNGTDGQNGASVTDMKIKNVNNNYYLYCEITEANGQKREVNAGQIPIIQPEFATRDKAGIVKIGQNLKISDDGTLSAVYDNPSFKYLENKPDFYGTIGDIIFNKNPQPGHYVGWVYTNFGWLGFGLIETISSETVKPFTLSDGSQFLVKDPVTGESIPFLYRED